MANSKNTAGPEFALKSEERRADKGKVAIMAGEFYPLYDRTPLPIDFSKFPSYLRPVKPILPPREMAARENHQSETEHWDDYLGQCEETEV